MIVEEIPRLYDGRKAIIAAIGPSLTEEVVEVIREYKDEYVIIGVNDAYKAIDFLDELYACDARWWNVHGDRVNKLYPDLSKWCHDEDGIKYGAKKINGSHSDGVSKDPKKVHFGSNSGYQAINLAYLWGCSKIILVGYNMGKVNGKSHFFDNREAGLSVGSPYAVFNRKFDTIQSDVKSIIVNCTPNSQLKAFRKAELKDEL